MKSIRSFFIYLIGIPTFLILASIALLLFITGGSFRFDKWIKTFCRILLRVMFVHVNVSGMDNLDANATYLFMCNHINIFDSFILNGYLPNTVRGVELEDHFRWPVWGKIVEKFGNIPISHHNTKAAIESLNLAKQALDHGTSIIILPEGHRTRDGNLREFKKGPFHLAKNAKATIVPCAMVGAFEINKPGQLTIQPGLVELRIGRPIPFSEYQKTDIACLRDQIKSTIQKLFDTT